MFRLMNMILFDVYTFGAPDRQRTAVFCLYVMPGVYWKKQGSMKLVLVSHQQQDYFENNGIHVMRV